MDFEMLLEQFQRQIARKQELEQSLPKLRDKLEQVNELVSQCKLNAAVAKYDLDKAENPGFFQRLRGNSEEKVAVARRAIYDTAAVLEQARQEQSQLSGQLAADGAELESLHNIQEEYLDFLNAHLDDDPRCPLWRRQHLCQLALEENWNIIQALKFARYGARADALSDRVSPSNQKLHYFQLANEAVQRFNQLLAQIPDHGITPTRFMRYGCDYFTAVTSEYKQLDRLVDSISELQDIRPRLKELMKEAEASL